MNIELKQSDFAKAFFPKIDVPSNSLSFNVTNRNENLWSIKTLSFMIPIREKIGFTKWTEDNTDFSALSLRNRLNNENEVVSLILGTIREIQSHVEYGASINPFISFDSTLKPVAVEDAFDVSGDEEEDVKNFVTVIENVIQKLGKESGFGNLISELNKKRDPDNKLKIKVIIGAGANAARIIKNVNQVREKKFKHVVSGDRRIIDDIFIVFGVEGEFTYENPSPLNFGYTAWEDVGIVNQDFYPKYVLSRIVPVIAKITVNSNTKTMKGY